jgi:lysophospholipase L1-like esterase
MVLALMPWCPRHGVADTRPDPDPARWEQTVRRFEAWDSKNAVPRDPVLFVGSSSIRTWSTRLDFPDLPVVNRGFGGSHISDVNHFAHRIVLPYRPRLIVFYAGDNDIAAGKTPQRVLDDFRTFVGIVHASLPKAKVIYIPIKPSLSRWSHWPKMKEANKLVLDLTRKDGCLDYADTATPMLGHDGKPRRELFIQDGLHLSRQGYDLWNRVLRPVIDRARASSSTGAAAAGQTEDPS